MNFVKTPCIGICSTTSLGDKICRGCKRFNYEVINWNQYSEEEKRAVLRRIDQLTTQIMGARFNIFSVEKLQQALDDYHIRDLMLDINEQLFNLSQAHFERYIDNYNR